LILIHTFNFIYSIRSIVCLNLPSFSGGLDPWGKPNRKKSIYVSAKFHLLFSSGAKFYSVKNLDIFITYEDSDKIILPQRDLTLPYVDDGLFELVGFRDAWHGLVLLAPNGHGTRLAQVKPTFSLL